MIFPLVKKENMCVSEQPYFIFIINYDLEEALEWSTSIEILNNYKYLFRIFVKVSNDTIRHYMTN